MDSSYGPAPALPSNLDSGPGGTKLWNCLTEMKIRSGDIIEFSTDGAVKQPLSSMATLEMQWMLNRVLTIGGAAGLVETGSEIESDDDGALDEEEISEQILVDPFVLRALDPNTAESRFISN